MRLRAGLLATTLCLQLACSSQDAVHPSRARTLEQQLAEAFAAVSLSPPLYRSALEAGPLTQFRDGDRRVEANADAVVVGEVIEVEGGRSFSWPDGPQEVGGPDLAGQQVTVGLSLASPVEVDGLSKELQGFGSVAVLLIDNSRSFFTYDPSVVGVLQYGAFLAPVVDGVATFPLSGLEKPAVRIDDLLTGRVVVPLVLDGAGEYQRADDPLAVAEPQD